MFRYLSLSTLFTLLLLSFSTHASSDVDLINLEMEIRLHDGRLLEPSLTVVSGKQGRVTFESVANEDNSVQIRVTATSIDDDLFNISSQILELDGNRWTVLNEVSADGYYGRTFTLDVGGFAELKVVGTVSDVATVNSDCETSSQSDGGATGIGYENCCVEDCPDGSGNQLRCCDVVSCSGCGTQCSP